MMLPENVVNLQPAIEMSGLNNVIYHPPLAFTAVFVRGSGKLRGVGCIKVNIPRYPILNVTSLSKIVVSVLASIWKCGCRKTMYTIKSVYILQNIL